jgi:hypothetical protein
MQTALDEDDSTALSIAARSGLTENIEALLDIDFDINFLTNGYSVLNNSIDLTTAKFLTARGANPLLCKNPLPMLALWGPKNVAQFYVSIGIPIPVEQKVLNVNFLGTIQSMDMNKEFWDRLDLGDEYERQKASRHLE